MKSLKSLTMIALAGTTQSLTAVEGPCDVKEPHTAAFVNGELLYWRPDQNGMTYCLSTDELGEPFGSKNKEHHQRSDWSAGFRVGAGVDIVSTPSDLSINWTRFHHDMHGTTSKPIIFGTQLLGLSQNNNPLALGGSGVDAGNAHSNWDLDLDLIELIYAYHLCFNKEYQLRPYVGVIGGWINQLQSIHYNNFLDTTNQVLFDAKIKQTNNLYGAGPKLGLQGSFAFGWGFGITGNLAAGFLYGKAHNLVKFHVPNDPMGFPQSKIAINYRQNRIIPQVQAQVGITWGSSFVKHFRIDLSALYEVQYFWGTWRNQNSAIQNLYIADAGYGNLMLQGGTFQLKLSF